MSWPQRVARPRDDQQRTSNVDDDSRLPLVTGEARFGPERVERDDPLAAIEIRHRRLMVGIAIDDAVFFGPEDAGA